MRKLLSSPIVRTGEGDTGKRDGKKRMPSGNGAGRDSNCAPPARELTSSVACSALVGVASRET